MKVIYFYSAGHKAIAVTAGSSHTCVVRNDYSVVCWGQNDNGELGIGSSQNIGTSAAQMGNKLKAVNLGAGAYYSFERNQPGQIYKKSILNLFTSAGWVATLVVAGNTFTCALRNDSNIVCWGQNNDGQLGIGSKSAVGISSSTIGNNFQAVNLGTGTDTSVLVRKLCWQFCLKRKIHMTEPILYSLLS